MFFIVSYLLRNESLLKVYRNEAELISSAHFSPLEQQQKNPSLEIRHAWMKRGNDKSESSSRLFKSRLPGLRNLNGKANEKAFCTFYMLVGCLFL